MKSAELRPVFSLFWASSFPYPVVLDIVKYFFLIAVLVGAAFYKYWWGRFIAFLGVWQLTSLVASFHQAFFYYLWQPWLFASFLFIFLPKIEIDAAKYAQAARKRILLIVWGVLALYLLNFTNITISRIVGAVLQTLRGETTVFSPLGYATQLAEYNLRLPEITPFSKYFIENPMIGWPMFMFGLYVFLFSFWAAIRPNLIRLWGFLLFFIETASYLVTTIAFYWTIVFLVLLLFDTPFVKKSPSWREVVTQIPIFGFLVNNPWFSIKRA